jgi:hypothetical protein
LVVYFFIGLLKTRDMKSTPYRVFDRLSKPRAEPNSKNFYAYPIHAKNGKPLPLGQAVPFLY